MTVAKLVNVFELVRLQKPIYVQLWFSIGHFYSRCKSSVYPLVTISCKNTCTKKNSFARPLLKKIHARLVRRKKSCLYHLQINLPTPPPHQINKLTSVFHTSVLLNIYKYKYNLYLPSAVFIAQVLVGPSKQLKQIIQI